MKKAFLVSVLAVLFVPAAVHAAWWNPFSWGMFQKHGTTTVSETVSTTSAALPSVDDLNRRIAELENKLETAQQQAKAATTVAKKIADATPAPAPVASTPAPSGLSTKSIDAKVRPAIVLVQSPSATASGAFIDASGHIIVSAHAITTTDQNGNVTGTATTTTITLASGSKKTARLVGLSEDEDTAILQIAGNASSAFSKLNYDGGIHVGDKVYVLGYPYGGAGSSGGSSIVAATITRIDSGAVEAVSDSKPLDMGGAMVNDAGGFIGIPNKSSCRVLEQGTNCLKYTITATVRRAVMPKLLAGMQLYQNKQNSTGEEVLIRGTLSGIYNNTQQGGAIAAAVMGATGKNSFDYFNSRLGTDTDGKIAHLYALKLKQIADNMYTAMDFLKTQAYGLHVFLINESSSIEDLGDYERATLARIQTANDLKLKEYQAKVSLWSAKRNEYDSYIADPSKVSNDYLMAEGVFVEDAADYLIKEKTSILNTYSGETTAIF